MLLQIQQARARLPLVELGHDLVGSIEVVLIETLDRTTRGIAEERRLLVVPITRDRVHSETLPELAQNVVRLVDKAFIINQDRRRPARHIPAADPDPHSLGSRLDLPAGIEGRIFDEVRIGFNVHPDIRTDQDMVPFQLRLQIKSLGGNHRIDTADLVANFPAYLEQIVGILNHFSAHF